jgi:probable rRNA maturation factor
MKKGPKREPKARINGLAVRVSLLTEPGQKAPRASALVALARKVSLREGLRGQVNVILCTDATLRSLNRKYRGLDKVTDVLSFGWNEPDFAGEVYIACGQVRRQAPRWNNNYFNELKRVLVHGMLHLCGFDHIAAKDRKIMQKKENFYLGLLKSS